MFGLALLLLCGIIGTAFLIPVLIDYVNSGLVPKMPSFVASVFFYMCMVQSFFGGMILQTTINNSRREFEIKLNEFEDRKNSKLN